MILYRAEDNFKMDIVPRIPFICSKNPDAVIELYQKTPESGFRKYSKCDVAGDSSIPASVPKNPHEAFHKFFNDFQIIKLLGSGGEGCVYLGE